MSLFLPSLGQAAVAAATGVVAAICVGLGQLAGARRPAVALVAGWGVGCLALLIATTIIGLSIPIAMVGVAVFGLAGLGLVARGSVDEDAWNSAGRTLLLAVPFLLIASSIVPGGFDEYSHWLPNLGYLYLHGHFPTLAEPNSVSVRPGYPYGTAFIGLAASLLVFRLAEGAGICWNALLLVAFASLCADIITTQIRLRQAADATHHTIGRRDAWGISALGLLAATMASPFFVARLFLSNYGDGPVGSVTGITAAAVMLWVAADPRTAVQVRMRLAVAIGMCCVALVNIRQDSLPLFGLLFVAAVATIPLERRADRDVRPATLLLLLPAPLLAALLWRAYQGAAIPGGAFSVLPFADWHWAALPPALWNMLRVAISKIGLFGLLLIELGVALAAIGRPERFTPLRRSGVVMASVLGLGNSAMLLFLYLAADFSEGQAASANEFWRFTVHIGPAVVAAGVSLIPIGIWRQPRMARWIAIGAPALAVLLPIVFVRNLRVDSPRQSHAVYLRGVAADLARLTKGASSVTLVQLDDAVLNLGDVLPVRYELLVGLRPSLAAPAPKIEIIAGAPPTHIVVDGALPVDVDAGLPPGQRQADMRAVLNAPFVWFYNGGAVASRLAGMDLPAGSSYLLAHHDGTTTLMRSWALPQWRQAARASR